jgi:hypothetical protein
VGGFDSEIENIFLFCAGSGVGSRGSRSFFKKEKNIYFKNQATHLALSVGRYSNKPAGQVGVGSITEFNCMAFQAHLHITMHVAYVG